MGARRIRPLAPAYRCSGCTKTVRRCLSAAILVLGALGIGSPYAFARSLPDTVARNKAGIVGVGTFQETRTPPAQLRGTGFAVGDGHYVATNAHVVNISLDAEHREHLVVFAGKGPKPEIRTAELISVDKRHDLALLRVSGASLPVLKLGDSDAVREGEEYAFTGFPVGTVLGYYPATHTAVIAAVTPIVTPLPNAHDLDPRLIRQLRTPYDVFQLDATAYPGNSGSPLYSPSTGEVIAVVNMVFVKKSKESILKEPSGIAFAIPAKYIRALLKREQ